MPKKISIVFNYDSDPATIDAFATELAQAAPQWGAKLSTDSKHHQQVYLGYVSSTKIPELRSSPLVSKLYESTIPEADFELFSRHIRTSALEWNRQYFREWN